MKTVSGLAPNGFHWWNDEVEHVDERQDAEDPEDERASARAAASPTLFDRIRPSRRVEVEWLPAGIAAPRPAVGSERYLR